MLEAEVDLVGQGRKAMQEDGQIAGRWHAGCLTWPFVRMMLTNGCAGVRFLAHGIQAVLPSRRVDARDGQLLQPSGSAVPTAACIWHTDVSIALPFARQRHTWLLSALLARGWNMLQSRPARCGRKPELGASKGPAVRPGGHIVCLQRQLPKAKAFAGWSNFLEKFKIGRPAELPPSET